MFISLPEIGLYYTYTYFIYMSDELNNLVSIFPLLACGWLILTNLAHFICINKMYLKQDLELLNWVARTEGAPKTFKILSIISLFISFRVFRLLFGKFFHKKTLSAIQNEYV